MGLPNLKLDGAFSRLEYTMMSGSLKISLLRKPYSHWLLTFLCLLHSSSDVFAKVGKEDFRNEIIQRISRVEEFQFIREEAKKLGIKVYLFGGSAAGFGHYVKSDIDREQSKEKDELQRFDYDLWSIFSTKQDIDLVVDAPLDKAQKLEGLLIQTFPYLQGRKSSWEIRSLREDRGDKQKLLNNPDFLNQHTDSNSIGLIEISETSPNTERIKDLKNWDSTGSDFLDDLYDKQIRFYFSDHHESTSRYQKNLNPPIVAAIRYLTKLVQYELKPYGNSLAVIKIIISHFRVEESRSPYVSNWIERNGIKLVLNSKDLEKTWELLDDLGLRSKLIALGNPQVVDSLTWWLSKVPLPSFPLGTGNGETAEELKISIVTHDTRSIDAFESMTRADGSRPNVFISRSNTPGESSVTKDGFYTMKGNSGAWNSGFPIQYRLHPQARNGADFFLRSDRAVIVFNRKAISTIAIDRVSGELFVDLILALKERPESVRNREVLVQFARKLIPDFITKDLFHRLEDLVLGPSQRHTAIHDSTTPWFRLAIEFMGQSSRSKSLQHHEDSNDRHLFNSVLEHISQAIDRFVPELPRQEQIRISKMKKILNSPYLRIDRESLESWIDILFCTSVTFSKGFGFRIHNGIGSPLDKNDLLKIYIDLSSSVTSGLWADRDEASNEVLRIFQLLDLLSEIYFKNLPKMKGNKAPSENSSALKRFLIDIHSYLKKNSEHDPINSRRAKFVQAILKQFHKVNDEKVLEKYLYWIIVLIIPKNQKFIENIMSRDGWVRLKVLSKIANQNIIGFRLDYFSSQIIDLQSPQLIETIDALLKIESPESADSLLALIELTNDEQRSALFEKINERPNALSFAIFLLKSNRLSLFSIFWHRLLDFNNWDPETYRELKEVDQRILGQLPEAIQKSIRHRDLEQVLWNSEALHLNNEAVTFIKRLLIDWYSAVIEAREAAQIQDRFIDALNRISPYIDDEFFKTLIQSKKPPDSFIAKLVQRLLQNPHSGSWTKSVSHLRDLSREREYRPAHRDDIGPAMYPQLSNALHELFFLEHAKSWAIALHSSLWQDFENPKTKERFSTSANGRVQIKYRILSEPQWVGMSDFQGTFDLWKSELELFSQNITSKNLDRFVNSDLWQSASKKDTTTYLTKIQKNLLARFKDEKLVAIIRASRLSEKIKLEQKNIFGQRIKNITGRFATCKTLVKSTLKRVRGKS